MHAAFDRLTSDDAIDYSHFEPGAEQAEAVVAERLLGLVAEEVASLAGPLAAVASLMNALATPEHGSCELGALQTLMPPEPMVYRAVLERLAAADGDVQTLSIIQHFHHRLTVVKRATRPHLFCNTAELGGSIDVRALAEAWRELIVCALAIFDRVAALNGLTPACLSRTRRMRATLEAAASGGTPCIQDDGCIEIPGIIERRRDERIGVRWLGWLRTSAALLPVTVTDISLGGAGLSCEADLQIGEDGEPVLLLVKGLQAPGRIVWTAEARAGFEFDDTPAAAEALLEIARREATAV